jgi:transcriptional regulator with XRE-family HTH domain
MIKERLKELRNERGINQRDLASYLNLSPSTIAMYETGQRVPDAETLGKIADYFQTSVDWLLGRSDYRNYPHTRAAHIEEGATITEEALNQIEEIIKREREKIRREREGK